MTNEMKLLVQRIDNQGDWLLIYGEKWRSGMSGPVAIIRAPEFHVIASPTEKVSLGDTIYYTEGGINFGWFESEQTNDRRRVSELLKEVAGICEKHHWAMIGGVQFEDGSTVYSLANLKTNGADELEEIITLKLQNRHL